MASSVSLGAAILMDGPTYDSQLWRTISVAGSFLTSGAALAYGGVIPCGGALYVNAGSGLSVNVATGFCIVPSGAGSLYGAYQTGLMSASNLTVATADPTNPRIDLVCVTVADNGDGTSAAEIQVVTGTPAPSPSAPSLPSYSIPLAQVLVPPSSSTVSTVTDKRLFTTAAGGVVPVPSLSSVPSGYTGLYVHDRTTGRLAHNPSAGPAQPHILPYAPVMTSATSNVTNTGSETTVLSLTFTSDGVADWKFFAGWAGIEVGSSGGTPMGATMRMKLDGTQIGTRYVWNEANDGTIRGAGELTCWTSGGTTPSAGSHTLAWTFVQNYAGSADVQIAGASYAPMVLRAEPVTL
jgi:hypothetical protein